jgi:hypothetical protein
MRQDTDIIWKLLIRRPHKVACFQLAPSILVTKVSSHINYLRTSAIANMQGLSRLKGITAGDDFLGLCDQKRSYKHVSDFGPLRSYDCFKLRIEGNVY